SGAAPDGSPGGGGSDSVIDLYEQVVESTQRLSLPPTLTGVPPPPGPGSKLKEIRDYAAVLSDRVAGLIQLSVEAQRETKRLQVLTTANPGDAPPEYRPAVADYFEKLARDRAPPAPPARPAPPKP
ncbi:MAG: hypothetical protein ABIZ49_14220, partial [Opitutaceae bacterium]